MAEWAGERSGPVAVFDEQCPMIECIRPTLEFLAEPMAKALDLWLRLRT